MNTQKIGRSKAARAKRIQELEQIIAAEEISVETLISSVTD